MLFPMYFKINISRSMCEMSNVAVFCTFLISWFPGIYLFYFLYFLSDLLWVPIATFVTGVTFVFMFLMRCFRHMISLF
jgi:hypothetical protein